MVKVLRTVIYPGASLSPAAEDTVRQLALNFGESLSFALIGERVGVMLTPDIPCADADGMQEAAQTLIDEVLSGMPDFSAQVMDDGSAMVMMGNVVAVIPKSELEPDAEEVDFSTAITARCTAQAACQNPEFFAAVFAE